MTVRMRHTRSHTNNRRSHHALSGVPIVVDKKSGVIGLAHRIDETTGSYRGKVIAPPKQKKERTKAEKYNHPTHSSTESVEEIKGELKESKAPEVSKHKDSLPTARRGA